MFKKGDIIKCVWKDKDQDSFTVGKYYEVGGKFYRHNDDGTHFAVVSDDNYENNGHTFEYVKMELVKSITQESSGQAASLAVKALIDSGTKNVTITVDNYEITIKQK